LAGADSLAILMDAETVDARAPTVVAVVATRDPGPWFDETLAALAAQDYEELSVLVLVSGGDEGPATQVARYLPEAYVGRLEGSPAYGEAVNQALSMVEGAAFFLLCHDDCVPDPDAVHVLVEESYRSNAGVVTPKMVSWEDPSVLLHVGMNADKAGAVVERVQAGEVDHGQHDAVRDVFVAPGGFTLVRADLFRELGGYDAGIPSMGEDLDLSWRAQISGARVVVAPNARVRHLEAVAGGLRPPAAPPGETPPPSRQVLQRRHELRAVLKCYTFFHLVRVVPQAALLAIGEAVVAVAVRDRARARAVIGAWRWNLRRLGELRQLRRAVRAHRVFPDREVRRLQLRGSARLSTYSSRLTYQGFDVAHGRVRASAEAAGREVEDEPVLTGSVGLAFSEDSDFDELDDLGHRSGRDRFGRRRRRPALTSRRSRLAVWIVTAVVLAVGTRDLVAGGLPLVGQFLPFLSWTGTWHHLFAGWQAPGVGTTAPASPAFGVLGLAGTVLFGGMGLLQKILVVGCIPLGAWGVSRFLKPLVSPRARIVAAVCYLGLSLPYDALAQGRWDGLIAYAAVPWILARLARAAGLRPFGDTGSGSGSGSSDGGGWRRRVVGQIVVLGAIEGVTVAVAPATAVVVLLCGTGIVVGSLLVGEGGRSLRALGVAAGSTVVAAVLCLPWVIGTLAAGQSAVSVFGLAGSPAAAPDWSQLLRFDVGPTGGSALSWLLVVAGLVPLVLARGDRLAWAGRLWIVACGSWVLALAVARGWTAPFSPSVDVLLAPAAVAVACGVGLGISAFEIDLSGYQFGWRQLVAALSVAAAVVGLLPVIVAAGGGRWGLPVTGYGQPLSFLADSGSNGSNGASSNGGSSNAGSAYRVLWLGDPRALPTGGWSVVPGLAYATSEQGTPDATNLWSPASPGPAADLAAAVQLAQAGRTAELGDLLAPSAVRYVVVVDAVAPTISGIQQPQAFAPPPGLVGALLDQDDLLQVPTSGSGYEVFENTAYLPARAERSAAVPGPSSTWPNPDELTGWHPVLPGPAGSSSYAGPVNQGTVFASYAPAGSWHLTVDGRPVPASSAFGWAAQYRSAPAGPAVLRFDGSALVPLGVALELLLWVATAAALLGRRRWLDWWWGPLRRRRQARGDS
jgi:GT2 family glycosyltransferase